MQLQEGAQEANDWKVMMKEFPEIPKKITRNLLFCQLIRLSIL